MAFAVPLYEYSRIFLYSLLFGAILGFIYDFFRISRILISGVGIGDNRAGSKKLDDTALRIAEKRNKKRRSYKFSGRVYSVIVFIEDILFFIIAAVLLTIFLFHVNFGQLRLYIYVGIFIGFIIYYNTVGRLSAALSGFVVSLLRLLFTLLVYLVLLPLKEFIMNTISVPVIAYKIRGIIKFSDRKAAKLLMMSEKGLLN